MIRRPVYKVDAFTLTVLQGSPAGIVPLARGLSEDDMLSIAREISAPETAFILPSERGDLSVKFFTPTQEVPYCGHALVAGISLLHELGEIPISDGSPARLSVETAAGLLEVDLVKDRENYRVDVSQPPPAFQEFLGSTEELLDALGADVSELREELPIELSYSGQWHLIVPLASGESLDGLMPDSRRLAELNRRAGAASTYVFVEEEGFHCRDFAPASGVDEELVTGSPCGALGAYLLRHGVIRAGKPVKLYQGEARGRPGEARVVASGEKGTPRAVVVGGHAVVSLRGEICLPE